MKNSSLISYSYANVNLLPKTKLKVLNYKALSEVNGDISFGSVVSSMVVGALRGALCESIAEPAGIVTGAILGVGAARKAIVEAAEYPDREKS